MFKLWFALNGPSPRYVEDVFFSAFWAIDRRECYAAPSGVCLCACNKRNVPFSFLISSPLRFFALSNRVPAGRCIAVAAPSAAGLLAARFLRCFFSGLFAVALPFFGVMALFCASHATMTAVRLHGRGTLRWWRPLIGRAIDTRAV